MKLRIHHSGNGFAKSVVILAGLLCFFLPVSIASADVEIFNATFDSAAEGFVYTDDTFRGTNQPDYTTGGYDGTGGYVGGGLSVTLGRMSSQAN